MADESKLSDLHDKVAEVLCDALDGQQLPDFIDPETDEVVKGGKLPPSAAMVTATIQFLKNNNITCVADENNALGKLQEKMKERQANRANRAANVADLADARETQSFLDRNGTNS